MIYTQGGGDLRSGGITLGTSLCPYKPAKLASPDELSPLSRARPTESDLLSLPLRASPS